MNNTNPFALTNQSTFIHLNKDTQMNNFGIDNLINQSKIPDSEIQQQAIKNIEPTFENGFHIRFQISSNMPKKSDANSFQNNFSHTRKIKTTFAKRNFKWSQRKRNRFSKKRVLYKTSVCSHF